MSKDTEKEREEYQKEKQEIRKSRKIQKRIYNFDVYFQLLMKKNKAVSAHHKAPLKKFMESHGALEATEDEFDRVFDLY